MKKKLICVLCLLSLLLSVLLCACSGEQTLNISPIEKEYDKIYSGSKVKATAVSIDGVLDEALWDTLGWWQNTTLSNEFGVLPKFKLTAFPTDEGIYFASVVYDSNLVADGGRYPSFNSNLELYFSVCPDSESLFDAQNMGGWTLRRIYVQMDGQLSSWYTDIDRAVVVEGELNSGDTTSATVEMFIPWGAIGYDTAEGIPSKFGILPTYRYTLGEGSSTTWMNPTDGNVASTVSAFIFDKTGYINGDNLYPDATVGDGAYGYSKGRGWDFSQIGDGIVHSTRGYREKVYFKKMYGSNFIVEATIVPVACNGNSNGGAGISFVQANGNELSTFLHLNNLVDGVDGTKNFADYKLRSLLVGERTEDTVLSGYDITNSNAAKAQGVKLTVVKYGTSFWYFADGKYLTTQTVPEMNSDCMPCLFSLYAEAYYQDYSCEEINRAELQEYLAQYNISFGEE